MISFEHLLAAKGQALPALPPVDPLYASVHTLAGAYHSGEPIHCRRCGQQLGTALEAAHVPPSVVYLQEGTVHATRPAGVRFAIPCHGQPSQN